MFSFFIDRNLKVAMPSPSPGNVQIILPIVIYDAL